MSINSINSKSHPKIATLWFASITVALLTSCSSSKPPPPPPVLVTRISPGQPAEESNYGAEVVVNSTVAKAAVVSINSLEYEIVLRRADGRLAKCKSRPGIKDFGNLKVGDEVSIVVGDERALALGKADLPAGSSDRVRVRVPEGMVALADAFETVTFTAKIMAIDQWNRMVTLRMADGTSRTVNTTAAVNLADFSPGDEITVRLSEAVVLVVPTDAAK